MQNKLCNYILFVVATFINSKVSATGYDQPFCQDLKPQNTLDVGQIMGMWYGVEIIPHLREEEGEINYDSCPVIHLSESTREAGSEYLRPGDYGYVWNTGNANYDSQSGLYGTQRSPYAREGSIYQSNSYGTHDYGSGREFRHIRLYWDESGNNIEYHLKFNTSRRGFWISSGPQSGALGGSILQSQYNEFAGTVQVMKAVSDHLVLTFCQRLPDSQLFTAILSREPQQLSRQVLHSIHNLLSRRDLSTSSIRKVCRNGSINVNASLETMTAFTILSILVYFGIGKI